METITFRCTTCQQVLKVTADKAGRTAKCSKCGTALTIPAKSPAKPVTSPSAAKAEAAKPPAPPPAHQPGDDGDGDKMYQIKEAPNLQEERRQLEQQTEVKAPKAPGRQAVKKQAKITNPDEWRRVGFGARVVAGGLVLWLIANLIYQFALIFGLVYGEEYAAATDGRLQEAKLDLASYAIAVVGGSSWASKMMLLVRVSLILHLLQWGVLVVGYFICLAVPNRLGTRLQLLVLLALAIINSSCLIVFKLLPMLGVFTYAMLPFAVPEIVMVELNAERLESINTFWLRMPTVEGFGSILMTALLYMEPALIATFLYAVGKSVKSDELEAKGMGAMLFGFSQMFVQTVWLMTSFCGCSLVLLWILRGIYTLGAILFAYQLVLTILALFSVPGVIEMQLGDEGASPAAGEPAEDEEDDYEDEEDEE